jgi:hypothetical protein
MQTGCSMSALSRHRCNGGIGLHLLHGSLRPDAWFGVPRLHEDNS